jgi:hypothetical protein
MRNKLSREETFSGKMLMRDHVFSVSCEPCFLPLRSPFRESCRVRSSSGGLKAQHRCSGLQTAAPKPANKGGLGLTFGANKRRLGLTIPANEPTFGANSPPTARCTHIRCRSKMSFPTGEFASSPGHARAARPQCPVKGLGWPSSETTAPCAARFAAARPAPFSRISLARWCRGRRSRRYRGSAVHGRVSRA